MMKSLTKTDFNFPGQKDVYKGKVRDVYFIEDDYLLMVASDRISAFDHILPAGIPFKGQVLNQVATHFLKATEDIVPNWLLEVPDPNVAYGYKCDPIRIEMVIRGYLTGHAWREYKSGKRTLCGVEMPDGMNENDQFPEPIITPSTKAVEGHDEDISREEILKQGIVSEEIYVQLEKYTRQLFQRGTEMAADQGLILVDTKYEFGMKDGEIMLMDEIHTPDSSRYFYAEGYEERQKEKKQQRQLSKEFVRQWLIENDFQGLEGQKMPEIPEDFIQLVTERYIELFEKITGTQFQKADIEDIENRIQKNTESIFSK
ncbi:phosphoribosylaminoimidazolesuccinocarboxamide synthase [Brumimicrobium aurantiacum]|uniref:Phosphoribosylaminoimidazole-succinocarboxamide synthase n=1 Tax=Brumimicrobium aurantiacum TaxID=1737063 RepID=A0A3E1EUS8_9FLAO|nr:phosphoribosylaminoimidazolesuccinocarboxamide synthase [Brumimicrobium aurantiacum]RFC53326.1 phosphoribosylaminoimidazolesuccinocarboxamide synthase [Brumimicrobium aurantiacum]